MQSLEGRLQRRIEEPMSIFFDRIRHLAEPFSRAGEVGLLRELMRHMRNELLAIESACVRRDVTALPEEGQKVLETLESLAAELWNYLEQANAALRENPLQGRLFDPRLSIRPMMGIFEFRATQRDVAFEVEAADAACFIEMNEAVFKAIFGLFVSYMLRVLAQGSKVRVRFNGSSDCPCEFCCEEAEGETPDLHQDFRSRLLEPLLQTLLTHASYTLEVTDGVVALRRQAPKAVAPLEETVIRDFEEEAPLEDEVSDLPESPPQIDEVPSEKRSVIIADDNHLTQRFLTGILEAAGYEVACVDNGRDLISLLEARYFDACLIECRLGVVNAYKATGVIRANEARTGKRLRLIGMATDLDVDSEERCLQAGMDAYLSKPVHRQRLLELLTQLL